MPDLRWQSKKRVATTLKGERREKGEGEGKGERGRVSDAAWVSDSVFVCNLTVPRKILLLVKSYRNVNHVRTAMRSL